MTEPATDPRGLVDIGEAGVAGPGRRQRIDGLCCRVGWSVRTSAGRQLPRHWCRVSWPVQPRRASSTRPGDRRGRWVSPSSGDLSISKVRPADPTRMRREEGGGSYGDPPPSLPLRVSGCPPDTRRRRSRRTPARRRCPRCDGLPSTAERTRWRGDRRPTGRRTPARRPHRNDAGPTRV